MHELGSADDLLRVPHQKVYDLALHIGNNKFLLSAFSRIPVHYPFIVFMPQWGFLNFLAAEEAQYPGFKLHKNSVITGLIEQDDCIAGVRAKTVGGELEVAADLVLGCDGRHSIVREVAGFKVKELGTPIDALWLRLSRPTCGTEEAMTRLGAVHFPVMINHNDYWQCGLVIHKGGDSELRAAGLAAFLMEVGLLAHFVRDRVGELDDWEKIKLSRS